jgi:hypothetical protein
MVAKAIQAPALNRQGLIIGAERERPIHGKYLLTRTPRQVYAEMQKGAGLLTAMPLAN